MPRKKLQKSLQDYLSKIKNKPTPHIQYPKNFVLSGCKHPKTQSNGVDQTRGDAAASGDDEAALADIDRFMFENFKSLYLRDVDTTNCGDNIKDKKGKGSNTVAASKESCTGAILFDSPRFLEPPRDLCGSARFFVAPGSSSSLMEEARSSTTSTAAATTTTNTATAAATGPTSSRSFTESMANNDSFGDQKEVRLPDDCIAVLAHSSTPYDDFKRSMQEMVDARMRSHGRVDWEFMEELLFCYLNLNEKKSHKYILNAFVDIIIAVRGTSGRAPARHWEAGKVAGETTRRMRTRREAIT